jgi:hypothetical protein
MCGGSGGALVLLLIVRNFHHRSCDWVIVKFAEKFVFSFCEYERLLDAGSGHRKRTDKIQQPE